MENVLQLMNRRRAREASGADFSQPNTPELPKWTIGQRQTLSFFCALTSNGIFLFVFVQNIKLKLSPNPIQKRHTEDEPLHS